MADALAERELKRMEQLEKMRGTWPTTWQSIADIAYPRKADITTTGTPGEINNEEIFDGTLIDAANLLSSTMASILTGAEIDWLSPEIVGQERFEVEGTSGLMALPDDIKKWMSTSEEVAYRYLKNTNFHPEVFEFDQDLVIFGTSGIHIDDDTDDEDGYSLEFSSFHPKNLIIGEDGRGRPRTVFRPMKMTIENVLQKWPRATEIETIKKMANDKPFEELDIVHVVRKDHKQETALSEHDYLSLYIFKDEQIVLNKAEDGGYEGYHEWPFAIVRWMKRSGDYYGESPALQSKPDAETLQETIRMKLKAIEKAIGPPMVTEEDVQIDMSAFGVTKVQDVNRTKPLHDATRFDVVEMEVARLQKSIENKFHVDSLRLPPFEGTPMTATEAQMRWAVMNRILGPILGRFVYEFHNPITNRIFGLLERAGKLPRRPPALVGEKLTYHYNGPLSDAQKYDRVVAARNLMVDLVNLQGIPKVGQEAAMSVDGRAYIKIMAEATNVPDELIVNDDDYEAMQEAESQQQQQVQAAELAKTLSEAERNVGEQGASQQAA